MSRHRCAPGWTYHEPDRSAEDWDDWWEEVCPPGHSFAHPPSPSDYPQGTSWECDCGKRYVSLGAIYANEPGICYWRRENLIDKLLRRFYK